MSLKAFLLLMLFGTKSIEPEFLVELSADHTKEAVEGSFKILLWGLAMVILATQASARTEITQ
jgi:hypothetical protein